MNLEESIFDIATRAESGLEITRNELLLVLQYLRNLKESLNHAEEKRGAAERTAQLREQEMQKVIIERDVLRKQNDEVWSALRTLRDRLNAERPEYREIEALENELDSIWGIWYDTGRSRYVNLNWPPGDTAEHD